jgi:hypothetical protein
MRRPRFSRLFLPATVLCLLASAPAALAQTPAAVNAQSAVKAKPAEVPASDKFKTLAAAAARCPSGTVVWSSFSSSRVYHLEASKYYGKTKHGAYMCEKDAAAFGYHASKR